MSNEGMSQEELDSLFDSGKDAMEDFIQKSAVQGGAFQEYDFDRPDKFNVEHIQSLKSIANSFARGLSIIMSGSLRVPVVFKLSKENAIEQVPYASEYVDKMLKDYFAFCVTDLGHKDLQSIIIEFDLSLVLKVHRSMWGGGKHISYEDERRALTEIEKVTTKGWVEEKVYPQLKEAFQNICEFDLRLELIDTDPQFVKGVTRPSDMVALIAFDVELGAEKVAKESVMRLVIPYLAIEPIMDRLTTENLKEFKVGKNEENKDKLMQNHLNQVKKNVDIELGKTKINLKELLSFTEGDVLLLDKKIDEHLTGYVDGVPKFSCLPGKKGYRVAVKVTGFAKKEAEVNE